MPKNRKPLTPREQLNNLFEALAEDAVADKSPPGKEGAAEEDRRKEERQSWAEKTKKKNSPKKTRD